MNTKSLWIKRVSVAFPYLLIIVAALGLSATWVLHRTDLTIYSLTIVIPLVVAAAVLLTNRKAQNASLEMPATIGRNSFFNLMLINVLLFIVSLVILYYYPTRPVSYFVIISVFAGIVVFQALSERAKWTDNIILFEIVLLSLNLIWGVTLKYPLYYADTDTLGHLNLINSILQTAHTSNFTVDYIFYPIFHIFNAIGIEITGMSLTTAVFVLMGLCWQVAILFSYLLFRKLSGSSRFALIACLLFATSSPIIFYASYAIARSLAFILMVGWVYLVFGEANRDVRYFLLSLVFMAAMIMTHHVNVIFIIPVLVLVYIIQSLLTNRDNKDRLVNPLLILLFSISCISYLLWVSSGLANSNLPATWNELIHSNLNLQTNPSQGYGFSVILGIIYYSFTMLLSFLGMRIVFEQLKTSGKLLKAGILALSAFILLVVFVPGPLDLLQFSNIALISRMQLMVAPFIAFLMAYGILYIIRMKRDSPTGLLSALSSYIIPAAVIGFATIFAIIGIGSAQDNNTLPDTKKMDTPYFTSSELTSFGFINTLGDPSVAFYGDYQTVRNIYSITAFPVSNIIINGNLNDIQSGYLLLRIGELERKGALTFLTADGTDTYRYSIDPADNASNIVLNLEGADKIFDDGYVEIFGIGGLSPTTETSGNFD